MSEKYRFTTNAAILGTVRSFRQCGFAFALEVKVKVKVCQRLIVVHCLMACLHSDGETISDMASHINHFYMRPVIWILKADLIFTVT